MLMICTACKSNLWCPAAVALATHSTFQHPHSTQPQPHTHYCDWKIDGRQKTAHKERSAMPTLTAGQPTPLCGKTASPMQKHVRLPSMCTRNPWLPFKSCCGERGCCSCVVLEVVLCCVLLLRSTQHNVYCWGATETHITHIAICDHHTHCDMCDHHTQHTHSSCQHTIVTPAVSQEK